MAGVLPGWNLPWRRSQSGQEETRRRERDRCVTGGDWLLSGVTLASCVRSLKTRRHFQEGGAVWLWLLATMVGWTHRKISRGQTAMGEGNVLPLLGS